MRKPAGNREAEERVCTDPGDITGGRQSRRAPVTQLDPRGALAGAAREGRKEAAYLPVPHQFPARQEPGREAGQEHLLAQSAAANRS